MKVELFRPVYGDDLMVVNTARVSFDKESQWVNEFGETPREGELELFLSKSDEGLIRYLARGLTTDDFHDFTMRAAAYGKHALDMDCDKKWKEFDELLWEWRRTPEHFAPFAHPQASFRITAPIFVARQLGKHQVGMVWSEVSRRYVSDKPKFFTPTVWRQAAENVKQGSSDEQLYSYEVHDPIEGKVMTTPAIEYAELIELAEKKYTEAINGGMCPEQARMFLPQGMETTWIWTGSLYGWANVYNKRKPGSHAQRECWPIAEQIAAHMKAAFPVSWEALTSVP